MKLYSLTFKSGLVIDGFVWSTMGYYFRCFPNSGFREQSNVLRFTREALQEHGIEINEE